MTSEEPTSGDASDARTTPIRADSAPVADKPAGAAPPPFDAARPAAPTSPTAETARQAAETTVADVGRTDRSSGAPALPRTPLALPAPPDPPAPAVPGLPATAATPVPDGFLPTTSPPVAYPIPPSFPDLLSASADSAPPAPLLASGAWGVAGAPTLPAGGAGAAGPAGDADAAARRPENPATSTRELPRIPADPATATTLYQSRIASTPRRTARGGRGGNALLWIAGGLCTVGMLAGVTLATGIVDIEPTAARDVAAALPAPARPSAAAPTVAPPTATVDPSPGRTAAPTPTPRPTRALPSVPARRAGDTEGALRSFSTRLCATAGRGRVAGGGTEVLQNPCADGGEQWRLSQEGGRFTIVHNATGRCLDAPTDGDLAAVALAPCAEDDSQLWRLGVEGTVFAVANVATSRCLDVPGGVPVNGLVLAQVACNGSPAQTWQLVDIR